MKKIVSKRPFFSGLAIFLFAVLLMTQMESMAMGSTSGADNRQQLQLQPQTRIQPKLFFSKVQITFTGKTEPDDFHCASFQQDVIDALCEIDMRNMDLLDAVISAADEIADCEDSGSTCVTIDEDNNVEVSRPSGPIVLEWTGTKLKVKPRPGRTAIKIDCFPLLVKKRLLSIPGIAKVNTAGLILYAEPESFANKLKKKVMSLISEIGDGAPSKTLVW